MKNVYLRAGIKALHVVAKSAIPALELEVELTLAKGSPGEMLQVPEAAKAFVITNVQGYLFWHGPDYQEWNAGFLALGSPAPTWYSQALQEDSPEQDCTLIFPLTHETVARMEALRRGRDATMKACIRITGYATAAAGTETVGLPFHVNRLVLMDRHGTAQIVVMPKSQWAEEYLPGLGWTSSKIIELPLADVADSLKDTDKLLDEAQRKFSDGDWTGSLTASRKAVETLHPILKSHINPAHTDPKEKGKTAEEKVDDLTEKFETLATSALSYQGAVLGMLHAGAHRPLPGANLERADAELGLLLALGLRRYVGVRMQG